MKKRQTGTGQTEIFPKTLMIKESLNLTGPEIHLVSSKQKWYSRMLTSLNFVQLNLRCASIPSRDFVYQGIQQPDWATHREG